MDFHNLVKIIQKHFKNGRNNANIGSLLIKAGHISSNHGFDTSVDIV